jgi:hypothetical protein
MYIAEQWTNARAKTIHFCIPTTPTNGHTEGVAAIKNTPSFIINLARGAKNLVAEAIVARLTMVRYAAMLY